jgi:hypothetical protein
MWSNEDGGGEVVDEVIWWAVLVVVGLITGGIGLVASLPVP